MSETIFIHCETYSRKPNKAGQSVEQVIAEGLRDGAFHSHIPSPHPPIVLLGSASSFKELHDTHVARRSTSVTRDSQNTRRAIRKDRHTLFTVIASYPVKTAMVNSLDKEVERLKSWAKKTCRWVKQKYGEQLKVALLHIDEEYPHIHFWLLPDDPGANAKTLHPGKRAKLETEAKLKLEGTPARTSVKLGNQAFKQAMRAWIDDYFLNVGAELGFHRDGPRRRRLGSAQYQAEKATLAAYCELEERSAELRNVVARLQAQKQEAEQEIEEMKKASRKTELYLKSRLSELQRFEERAERYQQKLSDIAYQIVAIEPMIEAAVREIENGTIEFSEKQEWLVNDPAPFEAAGKMGLRLYPAIKWLSFLISSAESGSMEAQNQELQLTSNEIEENPYHH